MVAFTEDYDDRYCVTREQSIDISLFSLFYSWEQFYINHGDVSTYDRKVNHMKHET
jgi:hypothetical protein